MKQRGKMLYDGTIHHCRCCGRAWSKPRTTNLTGPTCDCLYIDHCRACQKCKDHCTCPSHPT